MFWQPNPYALLLVIPTIAGVVMMGYTLRHRATPGAAPFIVMTAGVTVWSLGYALQMASADMSLQKLFAYMQVPGYLAAPFGFFAFIITYTGRRAWLSRHNKFLLAMTFWGFVFLGWTNEAHHFFYTDIHVIHKNGLSLLDVSFGPGFWLSIFVAYTLIIIAMSQLIRAMSRSSEFRGQAGFLLMAAVLPWVGNAVSIFKLTPWPDLDMTTFAFALSGALIAWNVFRFHLLDIVPVAHETIMRSMTDSVIVLDKQNRVVSVNPAAAQLLDRQAGGLIGQNAAAIFNRWPDLVARYGEQAQTEAEIVIEKDYYDLRISPLYGQVGDLQGRLIVLRDITRLKEAEAALREAKEAAEEASQAKSAFLANVSHELRTPLTSVLGFTKIIKKRLDDVVFPVVPPSDRRVSRAVRQIAENVEIIIAEGERLTLLINDVLDLAKIESGRLEWNMAPLSVQEIIRHSVAATVSLFANSPVKLVVEVDEKLPLIIGDHNRLIQVVVNLISNAAKFTNEGSVTCRAQQAGDQMIVSIIDTGIGIAPEDFEKIFEQFVQAGDTLTDKPTGTGLGLPISKQIVEYHGGNIWVDSEPGKGSTFFFTLPLAPESEELTSFNQP